MQEFEVGQVVRRVTDVELHLHGGWGRWEVQVNAEPGDGGTVGSLRIDGPWDCVADNENGAVRVSMLGGEWSELPSVLRRAADEVERATPRVNER